MYYMITYGSGTQIDEVFVGESKRHVIKRARGMINLWPEYAKLNDEQIIKLAKEEALEFDLVRIDGELPKKGTSKTVLIRAFQREWGG